MIDLGKLRLFYMVAQEGSVSKAARRLNIVQSALSKQIMQFEYRLKVKLFKRVATGMQLTAQGERLFEHAKKIFAENEAFERVFYEQDGDVAGDLKIITYPFIGAHWLVPSLYEFGEKHPDISIQVRLQTEHINPTEADVVISAFIPHHPHLVQNPLFSARNHLFASEAYLNDHGFPETVEDLRYHRLVGYRRDYYSADRTMNLVTHAGLKPDESPRHTWLEVESLQGLFNAVLTGQGIAELPNYSLFIKSGLKVILPELYGPELVLQYASFKSRQNSRKIERLYAHLKQQESL